MEETERGFGVNLMPTVKELNLRSIGDTELNIKPSNNGKLMGDPFIRGNAVCVSAFHHERTRRNQSRHLAVVERSP